MPKLPEANFIGFQDDGDGNKVPMFNVIMPGHELQDSTISYARVVELGLYVPKRILDKIYFRKVIK